MCVLVVPPSVIFRTHPLSGGRTYVCMTCVVKSTLRQQRSSRLSRLLLLQLLSSNVIVAQTAAAVGSRTDDDDGQGPRMAGTAEGQEYTGDNSVHSDDRHQPQLDHSH